MMATWVTGVEAVYIPRRLETLRASQMGPSLYPQVVLSPLSRAQHSQFDSDERRRTDWHSCDVKTRLVEYALAPQGT